MNVRELTTDAGIAAAFPLMSELRPHLVELTADGFVAAVRLQQQDGYRLSEAQAQRILEMQLQRLTGLEQDKMPDTASEQV